MDDCSFAVVPDETGYPAAVFMKLEEAIDWALSQYGSDAFAIRRYQPLVVASERTDRPARKVA